MEQFPQEILKTWGVSVESKSCNNITMIISTQNKLEKTIDLSEMPKHNNFIYSLQFYKIGEWNNESIMLSVDDKIIERQTYSRNSKKICSETFSDESFVLTGKVY